MFFTGISKKRGPIQAFGQLAPLIGCRRSSEAPRSPIYFLPPSLKAGLEWSFACPGFGEGEVTLVAGSGGGMGGGAGAGGGASCTGCAGGVAVGAGEEGASGLPHPARTSALDVTRMKINRFIVCLRVREPSGTAEQCSAVRMPARTACPGNTHHAWATALARFADGATHLPAASVEAPAL